MTCILCTTEVRKAQVYQDDLLLIALLKCVKLQHFAEQLALAVACSARRRPAS